MNARVAQADLLARMRAAGLVSVDAPAPDETIDRPWFISLVVGAAGWVAGILLLIFIGLMMKPDSNGQIALIGAVLMGAGLGLLLMPRNSTQPKVQESA